MQPPAVGAGNVDRRDSDLYHLRTVHGPCRQPRRPGPAREVRMYRPRHAKSSSKHWRRRVLAAASVASGTLLLAAPAFAAKLGWG